MRYHSKRHHRRSIRLQGYDYSQASAYFVTICTEDRKCLFGKIIDGRMRLNSIGQIVNEQWHAIPRRFSGVELDAFVVMPNHIRGIFHIVGAPLAGAPVAGAPITVGVVKGATARVAPTVGDIVGAYKSLCVHQVLAWIKQNQPDRVLGKLWQRNYWEHIVRDEQALHRLCKYIHSNPMKWELDKLYVPAGSTPTTDVPNPPRTIREPCIPYR